MSGMEILSHKQLSQIFYKYRIIYLNSNLYVVI